MCQTAACLSISNHQSDTIHTIPHTLRLKSAELRFSLPELKSRSCRLLFSLSNQGEIYTWTKGEHCGFCSVCCTTASPKRFSSGNLQFVGFDSFCFVSLQLGACYCHVSASCFPVMSCHVGAVHVQFSQCFCFCSLRSRTWCSFIQRVAIIHSFVVYFFFNHVKI